MSLIVGIKWADWPFLTKNISGLVQKMLRLDGGEPPGHSVWTADLGEKDVPM